MACMLQPATGETQAICELGRHRLTLPQGCLAACRPKVVRHGAEYWRNHAYTVRTTTINLD